MRPQRIGLIALLTLLATLAIDNVQLIQNPKFAGVMVCSQNCYYLIPAHSDPFKFKLNK